MVYSVATIRIVLYRMSSKIQRSKLGWFIMYVQLRRMYESFANRQSE